MTTLKEIYLLQEREDLLFVASELIKYYGLKSKVKFGTYGKDRYWANKWERKAENWAQQEYRKKWKNKF